MASQGGPSGAGGSQNRVRGLPPKRTMTPRGMTNRLDAFGANLLSHLNKRKEEARQAKERDVALVQRAEREREERQQEERRQALVARADSFIHKSRASSTRPARRRSGNASTVAGRAVSERRTNVAGVSKTRGGARTKRRARPVDDDDEVLRKPMAGMEYVVRKRQTKEPELRNTSDYSDLFGADYLVGAEVPATKELAKTSKEDTERFRRANEEKRRHREKSKEELEKFHRFQQNMEKSGELRTKKGREKLKRIREKLQDKSYQSVNAPVSVFAKTAVANGSSPGPSSRAAPPPVSRITAAVKKKDAENRLRKENAAKKAQLLASLSMAPPPVDSPISRGAGSYRRPPPVERRRRDSDRGPPRSAMKRKRTARSDDSDYESSEEERKPVRKKPAPPRARVYSDSDSDGDASDSSGGDAGGLFMSSFADVEEEELRSAAIGRLEDKRERELEMSRKKDKMARKKALGLD